MYPLLFLIEKQLRALLFSLYISLKKREERERESRGREKQRREIERQAGKEQGKKSTGSHSLGLPLCFAQGGKASLSLSSVSSPSLLSLSLSLPIFCTAYKNRTKLAQVSENRTKLGQNSAEKNRKLGRFGTVHPSFSEKLACTGIR